MNSTTNRHGSAIITVPSDTEILITRQFDAPPALVWKAWTTPELVKRWWGFDTSVSERQGFSHTTLDHSSVSLTPQLKNWTKFPKLV